MARFYAPTAEKNFSSRLISNNTLKLFRTLPDHFHIFCLLTITARDEATDDEIEICEIDWLIINTQETSSLTIIEEKYIPRYMRLDEAPRDGDWVYTKRRNDGNNEIVIRRNAVQQINRAFGILRTRVIQKSKDLFGCDSLQPNDIFIHKAVFVDEEVEGNCFIQTTRHTSVFRDPDQLMNSIKNQWSLKSVNITKTQVDMFAQHFNLHQKQVINGIDLTHRTEAPPPRRRRKVKRIPPRPRSRQRAMRRTHDSKRHR